MTDGQTVRGVIGAKIGGITLTRLSYRVDEAAHILGISETIVYEEIRDGRLQATGRHGAGKKGLGVTTESIVDYYTLVLIPKDKWKE